MSKPLTSLDLFPMFAHQGGWDEALMVAGPLFFVGLALYLANRRVNDRLANAKSGETSTEIDDSSHADNADSGHRPD